RQRGSSRLALPACCAAVRCQASRGRRRRRRRQRHGGSEGGTCDLVVGVGCEWLDLGGRVGVAACCLFSRRGTVAFSGEETCMQPGVTQIGPSLTVVCTLSATARHA